MKKSSKVGRFDTTVAPLGDKCRPLTLLSIKLIYTIIKPQIASLWKSKGGLYDAGYVYHTHSNLFEHVDSHSASPSIQIHYTRNQTSEVLRELLKYRFVLNESRNMSECLVQHINKRGENRQSKHILVLFLLSMSYVNLTFMYAASHLIFNGGVVGAVVRSLPSNHKAPGSNLGTAEC